MVQSNTREAASSLKERIKSGSAKELSPQEKAKIGLIGFKGIDRGRITRLADKYGISRTTVYSYSDRMAWCIHREFNSSNAQEQSADMRERAIRHLLQLRLECGVSLSSISYMLKEGGYKQDSPGFISQIVKEVGGKLSNTVNFEGESHFASDEIYRLNNAPIYITVDPVSCAVLKMELRDSTTKQGWTDHWQGMFDNNISAKSLISDAGIALKAAATALEGVVHQPDTFHGFIYDLGGTYGHLQRAAHGGIETEYKLEGMLKDMLAKQSNPDRILQLTERIAKNKVETRQAIEAYDNFRFLHRCILTQLNVFDRNGEPRNRSKAEGEVRTAVELLQTMNIPILDKKLSSMLKIIPRVFAFLDNAAQYCKKMLDQELVQLHNIAFWCRAWHYLKKSFKIKNDYKCEQKYKHQSQSLLDIIQQDLQLSDQDFDDLKMKIFTILDGIVQSSAAVEMFNSILRPYLNTSRGQITQEMLNLVMHHYNHRPFLRGKRKLKSPYELLTGIKPEQPWIDSLMDLVRLHQI